MTAGIAVFLSLTVIFALLMMGVLLAVAGEVVHGDAAMGQGIAWFYAVCLLCLTWLCLAGLLVKASGAELLTGWTTTAAWILWPASALAAAASFYLLNFPGVRVWIVVPAGIPLLIAGYVVAASLRPAAASAGGVVMGVAGVLCLAAAGGWLYKITEGDRQFAAYEAEMKDPVKRAERREKALEKLKTMTPDMPLEEWASLLKPENGVRAEALAVLRKAERRQADVERLAHNDRTYLALAPELDIKASKDLCYEIQSHIWNVAFALQLRGERKQSLDQTSYDSILEASVGWFQRNGCDCSAELDRFAEKMKESFKDSPERQKFLEWIAKLKAAR